MILTRGLGRDKNFRDSNRTNPEPFGTGIGITYSMVWESQTEPKIYLFILVACMLNVEFK